MPRARWILAIGWSVAILYAFPGIMTLDSFDQLREARLGVYTDGHPPAMALCWRYVDLVIPGSVGMFVIQTTAFVAGLYLVLRRTFAPVRAAWLTTALVVFPPVLAPMAVVWKDALMAAFLLLGLAGLLDDRRRVQLAGLAALLAASLVRYNTPAATLPLIVLLFRWSPTHGWIKRYAVACAAWVAVTAAAIGGNLAITDRPMHFWQSSLAIMDITGTLAHVEPELSDDELRPWLAPTLPRIDSHFHAALRARYVPWDFGPLLTGDGHIWDLPIGVGDNPAPEAQRAAVTRAWEHIVLGHPRAYLAYRLETTAEILGIPRTVRGVRVVTTRSQYPELAVYMGASLGSSRLQRFLQRQATRVASATPLFRPILYFVGALLLLGLGRRHRDVLAIALSGLLLEGSLFLLAATPDYRYSHWLVICTLVGAVVLAGRRLQAQPPP